MTRQPVCWAFVSSIGLFINQDSIYHGTVIQMTVWELTCLEKINLAAREILAAQEIKAHEKWQKCPVQTVGRNAKYLLSQPRAGLYTAETASRNTGNPGSNLINFFIFCDRFVIIFTLRRSRVGFFTDANDSISITRILCRTGKLPQQVEDCYNMNEQKDGHKIKFQFPCLVPED